MQELTPGMGPLTTVQVQLICQKKGLDRICHLLGAWDILWIDEVKCNAASISENGAYASHNARTLSNTHDCIKKQLSETQNRSFPVTTMS